MASTTGPSSSAPTLVSESVQAWVILATHLKPMGSKKVDGTNSGMWHDGKDMRFLD